jgi:hypothetical protein
MRQRGALTLGNVFLFLTIIAALDGAWFYLPHYYARFKMDRIAIRTLYTWRDTGSEQEGQKYLAREIQARRLPAYLHPRLCVFHTEGLLKFMQCKWQVTVKDPILPKTELTFQIRKHLDANGLLEDEE